MAFDLGSEPIFMRHAAGVPLPPVQELAASLLFAKGEKAIESRIRAGFEKAAHGRISEYQPAPVRMRADIHIQFSQPGTSTASRA
ncbi:MAG: hypothetical protein Q4D50_10645 [Eubacteriales bacterium]|nr:hypothetical protein [Eubacteriales bacterium]